MGLHILIADPRSVVHTGLRAIVDADAAVTSISETGSREVLERQLRSDQPPDMVVVHYSLVNDFELLRREHFVVLKRDENLTLFSPLATKNPPLGDRIYRFLDLYLSLVAERNPGGQSEVLAIKGMSTW